MFKKLKHEDVGSIGIGAMIVFIAMVLVAGIAASVLIQTSTRLESQAMTTGQETISEVATGVAVFDIVGYASSTLITLIGITVRARAGSQDVDLNETYIEISDTSQKVILTYSGLHDGWNDSSLGVDDIFGVSDLFPSAMRFGIMVLEDQDGSCTQTNPVLNKGDKVMLAIDTSNCFSASGLEQIFGALLFLRMDHQELLRLLHRRRMVRVLTIYLICSKELIDK